MTPAERLYRLKSLLDGQRCLPTKRLLAELEISPATLKRDIAHLRDRMNAPVVFDRERGGYCLDAAQALGPASAGASDKRFSLSFHNGQLPPQVTGSFKASHLG